MRISHKHKFIFISKPKCASSSIRQALNKHSDIISGGKKPYHHHSTALMIKNHFEDMDWNFDEYYKFISVRNPWDMLVSLYYFGKPDQNSFYFWCPQYNDSELMPFKKWIKQGISWDLRVSKWQNNFSALTLDHYILDSNKNYLVDYVMRVENLKADLEVVSARLELAIDCPHINKTKHEEYQKHYDEETKEIVAREFQFDIKYGNYRF